jgi:hypothetical protein
MSGRLGLPEVVEREVLKHGEDSGKAARDNVQKGLRQIQALVGEVSAVTLPTDEEFRAAAESRLRELEDILHRVPFTREVALRSLDRVNAKRAPARTSQQYKDCAIWEACLELARTFDVHLVTADRAFFNGGALERATLDPHLRSDCAAAGVSMTIHASLSDLLESLRDAAEAAFDPAPLVQSVEDKVRRLAQDPVAARGVALGSTLDYRIKAFVTGDHSVLAITFSFTFAANAASTDFDVDGSVAIEGQARFDSRADLVEDLKLERLVFLTRVDGVMSKHTTVHGWATAYIGEPPSVPYSVKGELPGGGEFVSSQSPE